MRQRIRRRGERCPIVGPMGHSEHTAMLISGRLRPFLMAGFVSVGTVIAVGSLYPSLQLPGGDQGFNLGYHGIAYGVLVVLGSMLWRWLGWVAIAVLVYSVLLEGLQYLLPGREFHLSDLAANALGVLVGLAIMAIWRSKQGVRELEDKSL